MIRAAFLFPGQGSQYAGMGFSLYNKYPKAKEIFEEADSVLGRPLSRICFSGPLSDLNQPENMLPAIFVLSVVAFNIAMEVCNAFPVVAAGHSLGEYSALVCSGLLSFSDALTLIKKRVEYAKAIMLSENAIMMVVDGIPPVIVESICKQYTEGQVTVGCYNTGEQCTLCGRVEDLMKVKSVLQNYPVTITPLFNSPPFHSKLMYPAASLFEDDLTNISVTGKVVFPVISNVTARPYHSAKDIPSLLRDQLVKPVQWSSILNQIKAYDCQCVIQLGGRSMLNGWHIDDRLQISSACLNTVEDIEQVNCLLHGKPACMNTTESYGTISQCLAAAVATQNYNFDSLEARQKISAYYQELITIDQEYKVQNKSITPIELQNTLCKLLHEKKIPKQDYSDYISEIFVK